MTLAAARGFYKSDFINYLAVERNLSPRTVTEYERDLDCFLEFFKPYFAEELSLETLDQRTIREFLTHLKRDKGYSATALNRKIAVLRAYFLFLEREGYVERSPMIGIKSAKMGRPLPKVLSETEVKTLLGASNTENERNSRSRETILRDRAILEVFYATGMRISELVGLDVGSMNLEKGLVLVTGKGNKQRMVLLNESAIRSVAEYLGVRPRAEDRALFLNRFGRRFTVRGVEYLFSGYLRKSGIQKSACPHTMRHSFATHMLEHGSDLMTLKELLGHQSLSTTQIYTNISFQHMRETYRKSHPRDHFK
ncbi:MAG: tyrosine recombinase XerC [Armatimonadetes bacterium]|nr:tyrosine recombinase XerC [Armatimonadota bacterium]